MPIIAAAKAMTNRPLANCVTSSSAPKSGCLLLKLISAREVPTGGFRADSRRRRSRFRGWPIADRTGRHFFFGLSRMRRKSEGLFVVPYEYRQIDRRPAYEERERESAMTDSK